MADELYTENTVTPPENLFYSDYPRIAEEIIVASGEGVLPEGQLMGRVLEAALAADGGNTGDADISGVAVTFGSAVLPGDYVLTCTAASADAGTFSVKAPNGMYLPDLTVASAYASDHINLTIPDGATDWAVDDVITVTVGESGEAQAYDSAATDGSQAPVGILAVEVDATSAAVTASQYIAGHFRSSMLTGYAAGLKPALRDRGIHID